MYIVAITSPDDLSTECTGPFDTEKAAKAYERQLSDLETHGFVVSVCRVAAPRADSTPGRIDRKTFYDLNPDQSPPPR